MTAVDDARDLTWFVYPGYWSSEIIRQEESNQQIVTQFLAAFSSADVAHTMGMMADSATWWVAGTMPISGTYDKAAFTKLLMGVVESLKGPILITPKVLTAARVSGV